MRRIDVVCRIVTVIALGYALYRILPLERPSFFGPIRYDYDLGLSSPDGRYKIAILRGDKSAIDDFFYRVYVFPSGIFSNEPGKGTEVSLTGIWNEDRYLVYSGYAIPSLRWTSNHEIEIDLDDLYDQVDLFHPVPEMDPPVRDNSSAILVSLALNKQDNRNVLP